MSSNMNGTNGHVALALCETAEQFLSQEYDYLIVGGGTAGLVNAARLSEDSDVTVGVIEAGKNRLGDMFVDTPGLFLHMLNNPDYDWQLYTTPQTNNKGKIHSFPRGKLLGGSSGINYMMYVRGSDADYDDWASLVEDESWASKNLKYYMKKHQTLEPIDDAVTNRSAMPFVGENHGTSGPVRTSFNDFALPIEDDFIKAADEATGLNKKPVDPWSGDHIGFFNTLGLVARSGPNKGKRSYAARGYFEPNQDRTNLKVLCEAFCTGLVIEDAAAKGVNFTFAGKQYTVAARREVLVAGGTIMSPQILELSGIGDPEVLQTANVECKVALPGVGNNFQDHVLGATGYRLAPGHASLDCIYDPEVMANAQKALMETQGGPLTGISCVQGFFPYKLFASPSELEATVQSIKDTTGKSPFFEKQLQQVITHLQSDTSANLQFVLVAATAGWDCGIEDQSKLFPPADLEKNGMGVTLAICLQYPASRGSVHITSSDPTQPPAIDPGYLKHHADVAVLAAGMKMLDQMAKSSHLKDKLAERLNPSPDLDLQDTAQGAAAIEDWVMGEYHPVGTCAMGDVVDSRLRVKGVKGLRVVDASVFPNHVSGNIVSSVYCVAEKAADMIKDDWEKATLKKGAK